MACFMWNMEKLVDSLDCGSGAQACRFKSCYSTHMHLVLDGFEGRSYKALHGVQLSGGVPDGTAVIRRKQSSGMDNVERRLFWNFDMREQQRHIVSQNLNEETLYSGLHLSSMRSCWNRQTG